MTTSMTAQSEFDPPLSFFVSRGGQTTPISKDRSIEGRADIQIGDEIIIRNRRDIHIAWHSITPNIFDKLCLDFYQGGHLHQSWHIRTVA